MAKRILRVVSLIIGALALVLVAIAVIGIVRYGTVYVYRTIAWGSSDVGDYMNNFPMRMLVAAPVPYTFPQAQDEQRVTSTFEEVLGVASFEDFMEQSTTQALIVLHDGTIAYEGYFNEAQRDTLTTSFSMAKSFVTALIGIAVEDGSIGSVHDPITDYLPELLKRDPRFGDITIEDLMMMAAGMRYEEFRPTIWNSDDILTTYYPDQRQAALEFTEIVDPAGEYFQYNKYYPQLLGLILERSTGMRVTEYM